MKLFIFFALLGAVSASEKIISNENWRDILEGEWMVKFYAPWCPACRAMTTTWKEFAVWTRKNMDSVKVGSVDVSAQGELNGRFMVTSLPTIYHVKDGEFRQYKSSRTLKDFKEFVTGQQWKSIKPMTSWLKPDSIAMTGVSKLFSFSMHLKTFHESLRSDYGLPGWASMLMFGLVIVVIGLLLGIGLVLLIDWFAGPQGEEELYRPQPPQEGEDADKDEGKEAEEKEEKEGKEDTSSEEEEAKSTKPNLRKRTVKDQ